MAILTYTRKDRKASQIRNLEFHINYIENADGSCLVKCGNTWVICTASIDERVPHFIRNTGSGWITAEYGMLPRSTGERMNREAASGGQKGRTQEIQRLIGRSLRNTINLKDIGERQIIIDCDVIKADGGTRTASINGAYIALYCALNKMYKQHMIRKMPAINGITAISCGIVCGTTLLDLEYVEDSMADVDANFVFDGDGQIIEVQCTGEKKGFSDTQLTDMLILAKQGCAEIAEKQRAAITTMA